MDGRFSRLRLRSEAPSHLFAFSLRGWSALDPTEAVVIRGRKRDGSFQPLGYLIITASVESRAFLVWSCAQPLKYIAKPLDGIAIVIFFLFILH